MANRNKAKGTAAETAVVNYLKQPHLFPLVERRALSGALDKGDIAGVPNWTLEVKSGALHVRRWMREADVEANNAGTINRAVIWKPPGIGHANAGEFIFMTPLWLGATLMKEEQ